jgi:hypothetical protein
MQAVKAGRQGGLLLSFNCGRFRVCPARCCRDKVMVEWMAERVLYHTQYLNDNICLVLSAGALAQGDH